jgi:hypothetical protein
VPIPWSSIFLGFCKGARNNLLSKTRPMRWCCKSNLEYVRNNSLEGTLVPLFFSLNYVKIVSKLCELRVASGILASSIGRRYAGMESEKVSSGWV